MSLGLNKFGKSKSRSQQLKNVAKGSLPTEKTGKLWTGSKSGDPPLFASLWYPLELGTFLISKEPPPPPPPPPNFEISQLKLMTCFYFWWPYPKKIQLESFHKLYFCCNLGNYYFVQVTSNWRAEHLEGTLSIWSASRLFLLYALCLE